MRIRYFRFTGPTILGLLITVMMFAASPASAQKFEEMFGDSCAEYGYSGVATSDGGYISVGSAQSQNGCTPFTRTNLDIYIVKLNANGSLAWARTIDIARGNDFARDVIQSFSSDRISFLVTGYTTRSGCENMGRQDIWLLRIDNNGTVQWLNTYGTSDYNELAFRLVECRATVGDERGEIAIAGFRNIDNARYDGLLLRTTPNGGIIYFHYYGRDGDDGFYGLIESQVGDNAGDLVLAGFTNSWNESGGTEGWAVRVGPRGDFYGRPAGAATYGGRDFCQLTHVAEVTATREDYGRLVFCGDADFRDSRTDPYFLKTEAWPCRKVADIRWGDNNGGSHEETWSIREIHDPDGTGLNHGNFIVAGLTEITGTTMPYMLEIDRGLNLVTGVGFKVYGRRPGKGYTAWPVAGSRTNTAGFYLTATSEDFSGGSANGSLQMYLVKTDNVGVVDCFYSDVEVRETYPEFEPNCVEVPYERTGEICEHHFEPRRQRWIWVICNDWIDDDGLGKIANVDLSGEGMEVYPNPVTAGSALTVSAMLQQAGPMTVTVVDMAGNEVHRVTADKAKGAAMMEVKTEGWASGTYIVTMTVDGRTQQMQVVIAR